MNHLIIQNIDFKQLKERYECVMDMHVHTNCSRDSSMDVEMILRKAKRFGFGVAITDHNRIDAAVAAFKNKYTVLAVPGIEVSTKEGNHVLIYFHDADESKRFYANEIKGKVVKSTDEVLDAGKKYKCVVGIAHMFGLGVRWRREIKCDLGKIDFIEVLNGYCSKRKAVKSYEFALKNWKGFTGGSDAHKLNELGRAVTVCNGKNVKEVLNSIIERESFAVGMGLGWKEMIEKIINIYKMIL